MPYNSLRMRHCHKGLARGQRVRTGASGFLQCSMRNRQTMSGSRSIGRRLRFEPQAFGKRHIATYSLAQVGGVANQEAITDEENVQAINDEYNRPVTDDYGNVWTKGGISKACKYYFSSGSYVARYAKPGNELGSWIIEVSDAKYITESMRSQFKEVLGIAGQEDTSDFVLTIYQIKEALGVLGGPGLPVGKDWSYLYACR